VVKPASTSQVSQAIRFANDNDLDFTIAGGGHSTGGSSSSDGGMVIDLRLLNAVTVDTDKQTVTFGGGCLWSEVNDALWAKGLSTVGGTVSHTGVGGLILGGGFGVTSGQYGLTIDVLLSAEVVLADGSIVTASDSENADLFWALRGAGASFGAVTQFTSRAFPQGDVYAGVLGYSLSSLPAVVAACNRFLELTDGKQHMLLILGFSPPPDLMPIAMVGIMHNGDEKEAGAYFANLIAAEPIMNMTGMMPYPNVNTMTDAAFPHGRRWLIGAANFVAPLDIATVQTTADTFYGEIEKNPEMKGSAVGFEFMPNQVVRSVPLDATAYANRGDYYNVAIVSAWESPERDLAVRAFNRKLSQQIRDAGWKGNDVGGVGQYNNYVNDQPISASTAFGANATRLNELKNKYDPHNRFNKSWGITSKNQPAN
jgi:hypothetical protein